MVVSLCCILRILFLHQTFIATGTNLNLQFIPKGLNDETPSGIRPSKEKVDFDTDPNRVRAVCAAVS